MSTFGSWPTRQRTSPLSHTSLRERLDRIGIGSTIGQAVGMFTVLMLAA